MKVISRLLSLCFVQVMILLFVLICEMHLHLLFTVQAGLDVSALVEGFANISLFEVSKLLTPRDFFFLLAPFGLFWLLWLAPVDCESSRPAFQRSWCSFYRRRLCWPAMLKQKASLPN